MASQNKSNTESLKESVMMNLRSVTQSRKGGVPLSCLERDYKDLLGTRIPYDKLGYSSLQSFLSDIPSVIKLKHKEGQMVAEGVADSSTAHIASLVSRQKPSKTRGRPSRRPHIVHRRGSYSSRYISRGGKNFSPNHFAHKSSFPSYQDNKHSKPVQEYRPKEVRPESPKPQSPPRTKAQYIPPRNKYEIPPRFLKQNNRQEVTERDDSRPNSPYKSSFRAESPYLRSSHEHLTKRQIAQFDPPEPYTTNFINEPYSNNHIIRSPQPKPTSRSTVKNVSRLKDLDSTNTSKEYVEVYARMNNLQVKYNTKLCGQKKKVYRSKLWLGEKTYISFPEEGATEEEAEEYAAKAAVKAIQESREHLASCPETTIQNAEDIALLLHRIEEIVWEKPSGMFTNGIVNEYENKFNETLPENWLELLQQNHELEVEELDVPYGRVPEGVNFIVRKAKTSSGSTTPSSTSELERVEYVQEESVPRNIVRKDHLPAIPELTIPFGNEWAVYIVDVSKTIAARLVDYDELFLNMYEDMKAYYTTEYLPAVEITEGLLYATSDTDPEVYHRVLVQKIKENDMVECYFVDEGVFSDVPKSNLQELNSEFWKLPYQAIHLTLDGLEDYVYKLDDLKFLLGQTFIALVKRWNHTVFDDFPADPAVHKIIYSVVLFNTNGSEDENMNERIKDTVLESFANILPKPTVCVNGYFLSHAESNGEIYVRHLNPSDSWLEKDLAKIFPKFEIACKENVTVPHGKICVAKYEDGNWYRAVLSQNGNSCSDEEVEVFFIDYGNTSIVPIKEICDLEPHSEFLSCLAPQAVKCELFNPLPFPDAEWTPAAVSKLIDLAPVHEELLIRVIDEGNDSTLPKVNLYKRTYQSGDSLIISINENLANKPELFKTSSITSNSSLQKPTLPLSFPNSITPPVPKTSFSSSNSIAHDEFSLPLMPTSPGFDLKWAITPDNIKSPDAHEDHDLQPLEVPEVPDKGEQFDIFVTMAAHPHNFYVQPNKTYKEMNELMNQMNTFYSLEDNLIEMHLSLLKQNDFYAVKHNDGYWYRAQLQSIINTDPVMVVVMYVDFGDIVTVSMLQLQFLYSQFRHLPCQGIKASLAGVNPIDKDWNPMQCVMFQNMVKEKKFVSIIQKKRYKENRDISFLELELTLIDVTDPNVDIYLHELLIEKGMARPV